MHRKFLLILAGVVAVAGVGSSDSSAAATAGSSAPASGKKPNIVFILADDLGLDGVGCYGADTHKTPNIDKLAASGLRFSTCYAAPLCGPSRTALMTGRYAFRTGGLTNSRAGAKSADEQPIARVLKQGGYATGMSGKWRQMGETPADWGFDEYSTDPTASGWYWQTKHLQNGQEITVPNGTYGPDVMHKFAMDFIERHKEQPFFFYYAMHLVHTPTLHTADSAQDAKDGPGRYDDNIAYMDKQVGLVISELERLGLRENTLVMFGGDNGTAHMYPSTVHGRRLSGFKGSMLEGGSRVPLIANWPGVTPKGKVSDDLVNFTDMHATFLELAGVKPPAEFPYDSRSIAPQLHGQKGSPREWAYVQLGPKWYVREAAFKMDETGALFDMSYAPFMEKTVALAEDTAASKESRARLTSVLASLNPAGGRTEGMNGEKKARRKAMKKAAKRKGDQKAAE